MMTLLFILLLVGTLFIFFEIFLPGGILGLIGAGFLLGGCVLAYKIYGIQGAVWSFIIAILLAFIAIVLGFKLLPRTSFGKKFLHQDSMKHVSVQPLAHKILIGKTGEVLSTMAPTGIVCIEGNEYEARSQSGMLKQYDVIEVIEQTNMQLVVRKKRPKEEKS